MKTFIKSTLTATAIAAGIALTGTADAAVITVTDSVAAASARTANGADVTVTVSGWGLDGGNAVVVLFGAENTDGITATFNGEALTTVSAFDGTKHIASFGYLINPAASTGDVVITAINNSGTRLSNAYAVFSLANVGSVAGTDTRTSNGALGYTTTLDGGYVLAAASNANFNGPAPTISGGNADQIIFSSPVDGNFSALFAHGDVITAGTFSETVGATLAAALVAFNPVPEPGSLALLGIGGLLVASRRRRDA